MGYFLQDIASVIFVLLILISIQLYLRIKNPSLFYLSNLFIFWSVSYLFIVHFISLNMGREGFSIFVKNDLVDDRLYYETAKLMAKQLISFGQILPEEIASFQTSMFGYSSSKSLYFSAIAMPMYLVLPNAGTLAFKAMNLVFFCVPMILLTRKLMLQKHHLGQSSLVSWYVFIFVVFICFYPTLFIRLVQIEKDTFLLFLFIFGFLILFNYVNNELKSAQHLFILFIVFVLLFYRPQFALAIFLTYCYLVVLRVKTWKWFFFYLAVLVALIPVPLILLKSFSPQAFNLLVAIKSYSVLAGATDVITVDYESVIGIYKTVLVSLYYYFFAPISIYAIKGSMLWKLMMAEPMLYFVIPLIVCLSLCKQVKNGKRILIMAFMLSIILALLSVYYESHIGSYMRKRLPLYVIWNFLCFYFLIKKAQGEKSSCNL